MESQPEVIITLADCDFPQSLQENVTNTEERKRLSIISLPRSVDT
jgi:hypothetical protein